MKFNLSNIMKRAWEIKREKNYTLSTALKLAWAEAHGSKAYAFRLDDVRPQISSYLIKLTRSDRDEHGEHKLAILRAALLAAVDRLGMAVLDGKTVGLCKYAVKNA